MRLLIAEALLSATFAIGAYHATTSSDPTRVWAGRIVAWSSALMVILVVVYAIAKELLTIADEGRRRP